MERLLSGKTLVRFQTGYFCLPMLPKEAQQLPICTPVTQRWNSQSTLSEKVHYITPAHCLDNLKIVKGDEYGVHGFQDVIHVCAHLKVMFLPSPLLCSVLLRLRDRLGMIA